MYKDPSSIKDVIKKWKTELNEILLNLIYYTFLHIQEILERNGNHLDRNITEMEAVVKEIKGNAFYLFYQKNENKDNININNILEEVKKFYEKEEYLIFTNYCSEKIKNGEDFEKSIDFNFLSKNEIKSKYSDNYFTPKNTQNNIDDNLNDYNDYKKKMNDRMYLSSFKKFFDMNLDNEILFCSMLMPNFEFGATNQLELITNTENNVINLEDDEIREIIKEILNGDKFYKYFFSILKTDLVKKFLTNIIYLDENGEEYIFPDSKIENSECFKNIYEKFMKYDDEENSFKDFKNLIIIKTLSKGDRACVITKLKKYIINPSQFFIGNKIEKSEIKEIIEAYLIVIFIHETEHFLRLLNNNGEVFNRTPRKKEGGRLFIKYIFGVESISHINESQAKNILNLNNWKEHSKIKAIFDGQRENRDIDRYYQEIYPNSISFYSNKRLNDEEKEFEDEYAPLRK